MNVDPKKYPKCKYKGGFAPVLVANPKEEAELGKGWVDHPDQSPPPDNAPSAADLDAVASEQKTVEVTKRPYVKRSVEANLNNAVTTKE